MSLDLIKNLDKDNLHHAYLIEGDRLEVIPEILKFIKSLGVKVNNNPDLVQITTDSFKMEDARNLKAYSLEKVFSEEKKIFIISTNNFLLEAQNSLLKVFEEPIDNTYFFVIVPEASSLLKTLRSRFYFISTTDSVLDMKEAENFIAMSLYKRIEYVKAFVTADKDDEEELVLDSTRSKALKFINALESKLHEKLLKNYVASSHSGIPDGSHSTNNFSITLFKHIFKVREFLRQPGSSTKTLLESVALLVPNF